jgi:hypothetical protein
MDLAERREPDAPRAIDPGTERLGRYQEATQEVLMGNIAGKILIGVATAALWFALSHAASAEQACRQVCDNGTCISKCMDRPNFQVIVGQVIVGVDIGR